MSIVPNMLPTQLLSIKDAAAYLKVSEKTLRRWEEKNILIPERTSGKHRRYTLESLSYFKKNKKQIVSQLKNHIDLTRITEVNPIKEESTASKIEPHIEKEMPAFES